MINIRLIKFFSLFGILFPISIAVYSPKILQGGDAEEGQFPFMVSLKYHKNDLHHCGGSILTNKWVMTAAHCCFSRDPTNTHYVFSGTIYLNGSGQIHNVSETIINEEYAPDNAFKDDICLLKIEKEFQFNNRTQPIVLPVQDWSIDDGELANVTGWGRTATGNEGFPNTLQVGYDFTVISNERCHNLTQKTMYDGYLCAKSGSKGQNICTGDSGGPLHKDGIQIGIVSFLQTSFCETNIADFYTRVPKYVNWIKEKLGSDAKYLKLGN